MTEKLLPDPPDKPLPSDCCNSGCTPCILDVYEDQLKQWEKKCELLKSGCKVGEEQETKQPPILLQTKYSTFKIVSITALTNDTNLLYFQAVEKVDGVGEAETVYTDVKSKLEFQPSQYFMLQGTELVHGSMKTFTRAYTPLSVGAHTLCGGFHVIIKLYPGGKMSQYLLKLKVGDITLWRGPYGGLSYKPNSFKRILMLCAGTGVAPLYALAQSIVHNEEDETIIRLLFCCKDEASIILRKEIHSLRSFWNFSADFYISHSCDPNFKPLFGENLKTGRLGQDAIALEIKAGNMVNTKVLICGSPQFCKDIELSVRRCNVGAQHIHIF